MDKESEKIIKVREIALLAAARVVMKNDTPAKITQRAEFFAKWVLCGDVTSS
jgi:hypothetical protein